MSHISCVYCCLLWIVKASAKDKNYIWISVRWKAKNQRWGIYTPRMHSISFVCSLRRQAPRKWLYHTNWVFESTKCQKSTQLTSDSLRMGAGGSVASKELSEGVRRHCASEFERLCPKERDYLVLTGQCSICIVLCLHVWASNTASFFSMYHLYSCRWLLTTQLPSANRPLSMCMHP